MVSGVGVGEGVGDGVGVGVSVGSGEGVSVNFGSGAELSCVSNMELAISGTTGEGSEHDNIFEMLEINLRFQYDILLV